MAPMRTGAIQTPVLQKAFHLDALDRGMRTLLGQAPTPTNSRVSAGAGGLLHHAIQVIFGEWLPDHRETVSPSLSSRQLQNFQRRAETGRPLG